MAALLFTLLAVLLFSSTQGLIAADHSSTLKLFHANSPLMPQSSESSLDTLLQTQSNDEARYKYLSSLAGGRKSVPIGWSNTYVVQAMIGTLAQNLFLAVDTNIDAGLVRCPRPFYNPYSSTTSSTIRCGVGKCNLLAPKPACTTPPNCWFTTQYNNHTVKAELVQDKIGLGTYSFDSYAFGCAYIVDANSFPVQGLLGLGRGQLSLLSQANLSMFSYCLPSFKSSNSIGTLILGPNKQPAMIKSTQLITIPNRPSLYAVRLRAILVDNKLIYVVPRGGPSATVMDTGTVFTNLYWNAYQPLRDRVRKLMSRKGSIVQAGVFDTCYTVPIVVSNITFMFEAGMNMVLPLENFIFNIGRINCLAMSPTPRNINTGLNIIASYQQQNFRVLINANTNRLGVVPERCTRR